MPENTNAYLSLRWGSLRWDTRTVSVHLNEPHWITSRVSKKTKYNNAGHFKSRHIDCAARLLYESKRSGNVWAKGVGSNYAVIQLLPGMP